MTWLLKNGFLSFLPGTPSYAVILVCVFGSIFAGKLLYKKELEENNIKVISSDFIEIKSNYIRHNATKIGSLLSNYTKEKL